MELKKSPHVDLARLSPFFFSIGLFVTVSAVVIVFEVKSYDQPIDLAPRVADHIEELIDVPVTEQPPPPPIPTMPPKVVEVPEEEEIKEEIQLNLDVENTTETKVEEIVIKEVKEEAEDNNQIFTVVEEKASFVEGDEAALKFLASQLKYPSIAKRMNVEGRVYCKFVVNVDGSLQDVQVLKGIGAGCDEEAVRVIKLMPAWKPAKQRGRPVRSFHTLFVTFRLD